MFAIWSLLFVLPAGAIEVDDPDTGGPAHVVGGSQVPKGDWEDAAGIVYGGSVSCTGTLIAPDLVLTAGHCAGGITSVILATNDYRSGGEQIGVQRTIEYPNSWGTVDVAVLILKEASSATPRTIARGCVLDDLADGSPVTIVGYGATDVWGTQYGTKLMEAETTVNDHDCSELWSGCNAAVSPGGEISAGGGGIDACYGDSGGPLYLNTDHGDYLVGVTSRAYNGVYAPCEDGGIYGRPDYVVSWIESETGRSLPVPDCGEGDDGGGADGGEGDGGAGDGSGEPGGGDDSTNRAPVPWAQPIIVPAGAVGRTTVYTDDPDPGDRHSFALVTEPSRGSATVEPTGVVVFAAPDDWSGELSLEVLVEDQAGGAAVAIVELSVQDRAAEGADAKGCAAAGADDPRQAWWVLCALGLVVAGRRRS